MWLLMPLSIALAATVTVDVEGHDAVRVSVLEGVVHVPACRGVSWERFDAEKNTFEAISGPICGPASAALKVTDEGILFPFDGLLPPPPKTGLFVVRPTIVYGEKCRDNLQFELSGCAKIHRKFGPNLVIRPAE